MARLTRKGTSGLGCGSVTVGDDKPHGCMSLCSVPLDYGLWKVGPGLGQRLEAPKTCLVPLTWSSTESNWEAALGWRKEVQRHVLPPT